MALTGLAARRSPRIIVSMSDEDDATTIALQGDADLTVLPLLVDMFAGVVADREGAVVLDLTETEYIDTACVRAVGLVAQSLADDGRRMTFRSPSRFAVMLLATFGLASMVELDAEAPMSG